MKENHPPEIPEELKALIEKTNFLQNLPKDTSPETLEKLSELLKEVNTCKEKLDKYTKSSSDPSNS